MARTLPTPARTTQSKSVDHRTLVARRRRERTRNRILAAATEVFASKGAGAPVIDDFIRTAGVARGTFYNHFQTVQQLLNATIAWSSDKVVRAIEAQLKNETGAVQRLTLACRLYLFFAATHLEWCAFMSQLPQAGPLTYRRLKHDLRLGMQDHSFALPDLEAGFDMVRGTMHQTLDRLTHSNKKVNCDHVVIVMLRGLGATELAIKKAMSKPLPHLELSLSSHASDTKE